MSMMLKDLPNHLKPRERLLKFGVHNLSNEELIAILLRTGTKDLSVKDLSLKVLKEIEKISDLENISLNTFLNTKGIGQAKAMSLIAALELGKRVYLFDQKEEKIKITNGQVIYNLFFYLDKLENQENLVVLLLDNKNYLIDSKTIFKGTIDSSVAHPREIFNFAIKNSASKIIIVHNHPSGDPTPSSQDKVFTQNIFAAGKIIDIPIIDHIIIGHNKYYTFKENKVVIM